MKRLLIGIAMILAIGISLAITIVRTSNAGGNVASANGSGHSGDVTLSFGAFDHGGGSFTGQATFIDDFAKTKVTVDVECLTVNGNIASVGGSVVKSTNSSFPVGTDVNFAVLDNGEGQGTIEDNFSGLYVGGCGAAQGEQPPMMVSDIGNIQVRFNAPDKACSKCPGNHCKAGYKDCCGTCVPDDTPACEACPK
jgi:hypothetical protein